MIYDNWDIKFIKTTISEDKIINGEDGISKKGVNI